MTLCPRLYSSLYSASRLFVVPSLRKIPSPFTSVVRKYREVVGYKDEKVTTIRATMHTPEKINLAPRHIQDDSCPLRSRGIQITPEDVLILRQFITSSGEILSQKETGLCQREYYKVIACVKMAQRSDMLPGPENGTSVTANGTKLNRYLARYPIGTRKPIKSRGLPYRRVYYKVGDSRLMQDAPYVSRNRPTDHQ